MILNVLKNGLVSLAVDFKIDDVSLRGEENLGKILGRSGEVHLLFACTVHDTWNHLGLT